MNVEKNKSVMFVYDNTVVLQIRINPISNIKPIVPANNLTLENFILNIGRKANNANKTDKTAPLSPEKILVIKKEPNSILKRFNRFDLIKSGILIAMVIRKKNKTIIKE